MKTKTLAGLALAFAPFAALNAASDIEAIDPDERLLETARPVAVVMQQTRIETLIELGRIAPLYADSLLAAIAVSALDEREDRLTHNARQEAEDAASPLFAALDGFDVAALALTTAQRAFATPDWFGAGPVDMLAVSDSSGLDGFSQAHPSDQMGVVTYQYQLSPDCTQIRVVADIQLLDQPDLKAAYNQQIVSLVRLPQPAFVCADNVEMWAADGGALARSALTDAFGRLEQVVPNVLALDEDTFDDVTDKNRDSAFGGGFHGPLLFRDDKGPVIWSKKTGFIAIQVANP